MSRYFLRSMMAIWTAPQESELRDEKPLQPTAYVEDAPRYTGLLSIDGEPIMATDRQQIGYLSRHK